MASGLHGVDRKERVMKSKVLLVDDDAMILAGLKRQLRNQFRIETALSGEEGLKKIEENGPYAVIISDYFMPGMNGIEFLCQAKERDPDTVRMMLTGSGDGIVQSEYGQKLMIKGFIEKRVDRYEEKDGNLTQNVEEDVHEYMYYGFTEQGNPVSVALGKSSSQEESTDVAENEI